MVNYLEIAPKITDIETMDNKHQNILFCKIISLYFFTCFALFCYHGQCAYFSRWFYEKAGQKSFPGMVLTFKKGFYNFDYHACKNTLPDFL